MSFHLYKHIWVNELASLAVWVAVSSFVDYSSVLF